MTFIGGIVSLGVSFENSSSEILQEARLSKLVLKTVAETVNRGGLGMADD